METLAGAEVEKTIIVLPDFGQPNTRYFDLFTGEIATADLCAAEILPENRIEGDDAELFAPANARVVLGQAPLSTVTLMDDLTDAQKNDLGYYDADENPGKTYSWFDQSAPAGANEGPDGPYYAL